MMEAKWNPWHGCHKLSEGCRNCYVYRMDARYERDACQVHLNQNAGNVPIAKDRSGSYKYPSGTVFYTCFTSDFFVEDADEWRKDAWRMMKQRSDCHFFMITKRIDRFLSCIPGDWGDGYANVTVAVTCENQKMADYRLPIYRELPIRTKMIVCEPLLECIDLTGHLHREIKQVTVGGESGTEARLCRYEWILNMRQQCMERRISFIFRQTGAKFEKEGKLYRIPKNMQIEQARRANINYLPTDQDGS